MLDLTTELKSNHVSAKGGVTQADINAALTAWGKGLVEIATAKRNGQNYTEVAKKVIESNYNYSKGTVLFKPTLASKTMFRGTFEGALSYFVGGNSKFSEDGGFALNPWAEVNFDITGYITGENHGIVMGNKLLKDITGKITIANFTMGFTRNELGQLKINLHHSSLPYQA